MTKIKLVIGVNFFMASKECKSVNSSLMTCKSPEVHGLLGNVSRVEARFLMDGGIKLLSNYTKLTMTPDPYFDHFEDGIYVLKTNNLILEVCVGQCLITNM